LDSVIRPLTVVCVASLFLGTGCAFSADPDKRNRALTSTSAALVDAAAIEVVVELDAPPGNLGVLHDGRVVFTFHPEARPAVKAAVLPAGGGAWEPFPDPAWQHERDDGPYWVTPLAVRVDARGRVWILDHGDYGDEDPSLTAFDPESREVLHRHLFPDVADWGSMLNDFVVDAERDVVYLADTSAFDFDPCLIVYDVASGESRRVLEDEECVDFADLHLVVQGRFMKAFGMSLQLGVDSIALSGDGTWLYFGPLTGDRLYRVPTAALRDADLDPDALLAQVEDYARKPCSDGAIGDARDNVYLTAIEHDALVVVRPGGGLEVLTQDRELLAWPDGLALDRDQAWLYASVSELHHVIGEDLDELSAHRPFRIVRVPLPPE
jgi:sugar lactone lactonase YvrE